MKKILFVLTMAFIFISFVSAQQVVPNDVFRSDTRPNLTFSCIDEFTGLPCDVNYICNISIYDPDNIKLIDNELATRSGTEYYYPLNNTQKLGFYKYNPYCTNGTQGGSPLEQQYFQVTPTGTILSTSQGIIYLIVLILSIFIFGLSLFGAIKIKWSHGRNVENRIVQMNDLRYLKLGLWFISYALIVWISFLMWNITYGFLNFNVASNFFEVMFKFLAIMMFPAFVILIVALIAALLFDQKIRKKLKRGLPVR